MASAAVAMSAATHHSPTMAGICLKSLKRIQAGSVDAHWRPKREESISHFNKERSQPAASRLGPWVARNAGLIGALARLAFAGIPARRDRSVKPGRPVDKRWRSPALFPAPDRANNSAITPSWGHADGAECAPALSRRGGVL